MAVHLAFALALLETLALVGLLSLWGDRVAGSRLLRLFLLGVALWMVANELPNWFGRQADEPALALLGVSALIAAVFLHFCLVFCGWRVRRSWLVLAYGAGAATTLLSWTLGPGQFDHVPGLGRVPIGNWVGWTTSFTWAGLGAAGMGVLFTTWLRSQGTQRLQLAAVMLSCGWGLFCMTGYGLVALRLPYYPWQLLGLPLYPLMLVYGILRYRVFVANAWARRALVWALLLGLGLAVVSATLWLPTESRWWGGAVVALTCFALAGPVRRVAERLVYPGGQVSAADLTAWRASLHGAASLQALAEAAHRLLSQRLKTEVAVTVGDARAGAEDAPRLLCQPDGDAWRTTLHGFDSAPPGPRLAAELFGSTLAEAAPHVAQAEQREAQAREQQLQARLAELGQLAATVAHDVRNPLNIISMAVAMAPPETKREVAEQVQRIARLTGDLLDYAKPWQLQPQALDLAEQVREAVRRLPGVVLGPGLQAGLSVQADPLRLQQALGNLLQNAQAAAGPRRIMVDAEADDRELRLHVCDDGPGVPAELRDRLFQPFASRSPGGTGLGLAIVARIMAAHGGQVSLGERPPFNTCFTLHFPR